MKKSIGLDIKPPEKKCEDSKCVWHGSLPIRGKVINAVVKSAKSPKIAVVESHYHKMITKYESYERRKTTITAYNPDCMKVKEGDKVLVAECRPISKTKSFSIVGVVK